MIHLGKNFLTQHSHHLMKNLHQSQNNLDPVLQSAHHQNQILHSETTQELSFFEIFETFHLDIFPNHKSIGVRILPTYTIQYYFDISEFFLENKEVSGKITKSKKFLGLLKECTGIFSKRLEQFFQFYKNLQFIYNKI